MSVRSLVVAFAGSFLLPRFPVCPARVVSIVMKDLCVDGRTSSSQFLNQTDEQKDHALSFSRTSRRQLRILDESHHCCNDQNLEYWLTECMEATSRVPMSSFLVARAYSTSSSSNSVAFEVMETVTFPLKW